MCLAAAVSAAGCGNASTVTPGAATDAPSCATSKPIKHLPVAVVGVSGQGRVCWETPLNVPPLGAHTGSTPVVTGGSAFLGSDGQVFAVSVGNGQRARTWSARAGSRSATAMVSAGDGVVIVKRDGLLIGLDERTGAKRWERVVPPEALGPLSSGDGGLLLVLRSGEASQVIERSDGRVRWQRPPQPPIGGQPSGQPLATAYDPVIVGDVVVTTLTSGGVEAVSIRTGASLWRRAAPVNQLTAAAGLLVVTPPPGPPGAYNVPAAALDPATGRQLWQSRPFDPGGAKVSDVGGALLYQDIVDPTLARLDPVTGQERWRVATRPVHQMAAGGGLVSLESAQYTNCPCTFVGRDLATGAERWRTPAPSTASSAYATFLGVQGPAGELVVLIEGAELTAFDVTRGTLAWHMVLPASAVVDGITAVAAGGLVLQLSDCRYRAPSRSTSCPATP